MRILVVDDEHSVRVALVRLLEQRGHEVCWAATARAALALMRTEAPDFIVLDILLGAGEMTGWDVLREKLEDDGIRHIPVVVLTGLSTSQVYDGAEAVKNAMAGAVLILGKPLDAEVLFKAIEHTTARKDGG